jgi:hypothetical protein
MVGRPEREGAAGVKLGARFGASKKGEQDSWMRTGSRRNPASDGGSGLMMGSQGRPRPGMAEDARLHAGLEQQELAGMDIAGYLDRYTLPPRMGTPHEREPDP